MEAGRHAGFIWSAYGATFLILTVLVVRAVLDHRTTRRALARLEGRDGTEPA